MQHNMRGTPIDWPDSIGRGDPPSLAVWKFASCDGCQLSLLDCEDELLAVADRVDIAYFPEASSGIGRRPVRRLARGGFDHDTARRRTDSRDPASSRVCSSRSAPVPRPAASRRSATDATSRSSRRSCTPIPSTSRRWRRRRRSPTHVHGRPRAPRLPDRSRPTRSQTIVALLNRHAAAIADHERVRRVQGTGRRRA